ncbi:MAG: hypothetical protein ACI8SE_001489 [Bacteroidia bacterium]|jgi:hypothetical protein
MDQVPFYLSLSFIALVVFTLITFFNASGKNKGALMVVLAFALAQALLSQRGFFLDSDAIPPRLLFILLPTVTIIVLAFITRAGKRLIVNFDLEQYTYLHTVRVGVEIVLFYLFVYQLVPESMTFSGRNFDILAGLTAPIMGYWGFRKSKISKRWLLIWNWVCLALVCQVMITGILSVPSPIQQLSFDAPNTGVLHFPFVWLPGIIVPIVIFGHLVTIKRLSKSDTT